MSIQQDYKNIAIPALMKEFEIKNPMALPRISKVVINMGVKEAAHDKGVLDKVVDQLTTIAGQKVKITTAKLSIAGFKVREGDPVGVTATLRGKRMDDFVKKLITIVLPRVRDFQGVSLTAFDSRGNYTLGLTEQIVFPEIDYAKVDKIRSLEVTLVMKNANAKIAHRLLELLGMPFAKEVKKRG